MNHIEYFEYHRMWDRYDLCWRNLHSDVNILVGINGKGKTTLLNAIYDYYTRPSSFSRKYGDSLEANPLECPVKYIQSSDVPTKKKGNSPLYENLMNVVLQNGEQDSFFNYRMRALNFEKEADRVKARIELLFNVVDSFFCQTGKRIAIDREKNILVFIEDGNPGSQITLDLLSAGEKQLLYMLLTVFLMDEKPFVLLLDEPELSLHIEWQEKLIRALRELNGNCQLILTTHSPSIFASGWESHLTYIEDLLSETKL